MFIEKFYELEKYLGEINGNLPQKAKSELLFFIEKDFQDWAKKESFITIESEVVFLYHYLQSKYHVDMPKNKINSLYNYLLNNIGLYPKCDLEPITNLEVVQSDVLSAIDDLRKKGKVYSFQLTNLELEFLKKYIIFEKILENKIDFLIRKLNLNDISQQDKEKTIEIVFGLNLDAVINKKNNLHTKNYSEMLIQAVEVPTTTNNMSYKDIENAIIDIYGLDIEKDSKLHMFILHYLFEIVIISPTHFKLIKNYIEYKSTNYPHLKEYKNFARHFLGELKFNN